MPRSDQRGRLAASAWHGRPSWGRRLVRAYPPLAVLTAIAVILPATLAAQRVLSVLPGIRGTGGAMLTGVIARPIAVDSTAMTTGGPPGVLVFTRPGAANVHIQGSSSLAIPSYIGWEANGSDRTGGYAFARSGHLVVGDHFPTPTFLGWFLTATAPTAASCTFHFWADPAPPLPATRHRNAIGELVAAVQTSNTVRTGDINYAYLTENVFPSGTRTMVAGYAVGHVANAVSHALRTAPWHSNAPLHMVFLTNGTTQLTVWINGVIFYSGHHLHMRATPPFEAYLEVQAVHTPYAVSFSRYASVCGNGVRIGGLPDGSTVTLGGLQATVRSHAAVLPLASYVGPVNGTLVVAEPGGRVMAFPRHQYWPGDRLTLTQRA